MASSKHQTKNWTRLPKSKFSPPPKRILIFTEGKTEENYLKSLSKQNKTKEIHIRIRHIKANKKEFVERVVNHLERIGELTSKKDKPKLTDNLQVWIVLDRDVQRAPATKDESAFKEAMEIAHENKLKVAWSNDSFELWLILHFQDVHANTNMTAPELIKQLKPHYPKFKKAKKNVYTDIQRLGGDYNLACSRANKLLEKHGTQDDMSLSQKNPSTTIHKLIREITRK